MKFCFHLLHLNPYEPPNCKLPNFRPCSSEKSPPTHHHSPQMIPDRCVCSVVYTLSSIYLSKGWHIQPLSQAGGEYKAVGDLCEGHRARSLKDQVEQERSSRILEGKSMGLPETGWNNEMPAQQGHGLGRPSLCCGTYRTWCTFSTIIELTWTRGARSILSINEWSSNVYISTLIRHIHCDWCTHENFSGWWIWILYIYIYQDWGHEISTGFKESRLEDQCTHRYAPSTYMTFSPQFCSYDTTRSIGYVSRTWR